MMLFFTNKHFSSKENQKTKHKIRFFPLWKKNHISKNHQFTREFPGKKQLFELAATVSETNFQTSNFLGCRQWAKFLPNELKKEAFWGAPFLPYKCFPPKSVFAGPISFLLSIWYITLQESQYTFEIRTRSEETILKWLYLENLSIFQVVSNSRPVYGLRKVRTESWDWV